MMEGLRRGGDAVEPFDTTRPNIARVWDYWLGGKDNFTSPAICPVSLTCA
jgi:hypothetical protein